jgi:hypothetical protein
MTREARLKPDYAHLYPGIEPGTWEPAGELAERALTCRLLLPSDGFALAARPLRCGHFEFRGGVGPRLARPHRLVEDPRAPRARRAAGGATF